MNLPVHCGSRPINKKKKIHQILKKHYLRKMYRITAIPFVVVMLALRIFEFRVLRVFVLETSSRIKTSFISEIRDFPVLQEVISIIELKYLKLIKFQRNHKFLNNIKSSEPNTETRGRAIKSNANCPAAWCRFFDGNLIGPVCVVAQHHMTI